MKAICAGSTTRNDVVQKSVEQYKDVFVKSARQIGVLKEVSVSFYAHAIVLVLHSSLIGGWSIRPCGGMFLARARMAET